MEFATETDYSEQFLLALRELSLDDGRVYIQQHSEEALLADREATGNLLADEALNQLYTDPAVSLKLADLLMYYGDYYHHTLSHALGLKAKGDALRAIGLHQAAIDNLDAAGQEFLHLADEGNWARSRISWIVSAAWLGRVDDALAEAKRARDVFLRLREYFWSCVIDHNTAFIYEQVGRYEDAYGLYKTMIDVYPTLTDSSDMAIKRAIAMAKVNHAINLACLGDFQQAYLFQREALSTFVELQETRMIINAEINVADLDYNQGHYGSALRRYYHALDMLTQHAIDEPLLLAELKLWMANCLVKINKPQEACLLADEAVEIYRSAGVSLNTGIALSKYSVVLSASGRMEEALATLHEAWELFQAGGFEHHAAVTMLHRAELLLEGHFLTEAYHEAEILQIHFEKKGLVSRSVRATLVMIDSLIEQLSQVGVQAQPQLLHRAAQLCERAILLSNRYNLREQLYKSFYFSGRLCVLQGDVPTAIEHYDAAIDQIEHMLGDLVYDLSPLFLHSTWKVYEDMIALRLQQQQTTLAFEYLERARSVALRQYLNKSFVVDTEESNARKDTYTSIVQLNNAATLRTQYELRDWQEKYRDYSVLLADSALSPEIDRDVIQRELKRCEAKLNELFERLHLYQTHVGIVSRQKQHIEGSNTIHTIDVEGLRQQLAPGQLMLAYLLQREKLVIFALTRESLTTYEVADGSSQLERLLPLLHAHLQPGGWSDVQHPPQQVVRRLLNKLYNVLMAPVAALLPDDGLLTIVPYGPLHKLPFHALYDGTQFLVERCQVQYLPASSLLVHLAERTNERQHHLSGTTMPVKRPLVLGYSGNGQLQRTINEARQLAEMLEGRCYLEREATVAHLSEQASGSPIIHIATHGHSRLDAPNFSYVLLADGQLNAIDAFSLDLSSCQLVTLSGCETGISLSGGGDEQLGLGRAFLAAGVDSLVISLWPVEDNATGELMHRFYQRLLQGDTKSQALRSAQCSLLHSESANYAHPYFWAAFRLVGSTDTISL